MAATYQSIYIETRVVATDSKKVTAWASSGQLEFDRLKIITTSNWLIIQINPYRVVATLIQEANCSI